MLSATQYFHDLLLADLTLYLFGLYHSQDNGLQWKPRSFTGRLGTQLLRCQGKGKTVEQDDLDVKAPYFRAVSSWANYFLSLALSFPVYKMGLKIVPTSLSCCED